MRIAQINVTSNLSTGRIACGLARVCVDAGHSAKLFFSRGPNPEDLPFYRTGAKVTDSVPRAGMASLWRNYWDRIQNRANTNLHVLTTRLMDRPGFVGTPFLKLQTRKLIRSLDRYAPDLVHLHNVHGYYVYLPMLFRYLKEKQIPVVWTLHDCWSYTGHCAYYSNVRDLPSPNGPADLPGDARGCQRWRTGCGKCPIRHNYPCSWLLDRSERNYREKSALFTDMPYLIPVTPSIWLQREAAQSFWAPYASRIRCFPSGLDLSVFHPCEDGETMYDVLAKYGLDRLEDRYLVLSVAAVWEPRKGLEDLIELSKMLGKDYCVVCVGLDAQQMDAVPRKTIVPLPRTENVAELCALYTAADLYVSASYEETQGMTLLEALACGTQVLCYDATALPEIVTPKVGRTVPAGDLDALTDAVELMCCDPLNGADCIARVEEYEAGKCFSRYLELYESMYRHSPAYREARAQTDRIRELALRGEVAEDLDPDELYTRREDPHRSPKPSDVAYKLYQKVKIDK